MLGRVVFGSRTWICTIAAPALAASTAERAICAGVTGTAGLRPGVSADPVTAHEIMTLRCMAPPSRCPALARERTLGERGTQAESVHGAPAQPSSAWQRAAWHGPSCLPLCTA